jgi:ubiquinone/menaquinone biosynthesis C-methylase UbiE
MLTVEAIRQADYSTLVGLVRERNRPSGGIRTLHEFSRHALLAPGKTVLEVGCNTGFSVVNLAMLAGVHVHGIDLNAESIAEAQTFARVSGVGNLATLRVGDALGLPYADHTFDALWVSNVTSFIDDKSAAFREYLRVLKPFGYLGVAPIYYRSSPPSELLLQVEALIGARITVQDLAAWRLLIEQAASQANSHVVECVANDYVYLDQSARIGAWLAEILSKPHLRHLPLEVQQALADRYSACMRTFNENLKYCGYSLLVYQKRIQAEEAELFYTEKV